MTHPSAAPPSAGGGPAVDRVVLRNYPVRLGAAADEHMHDIMREFQLMAMSSQGDTAVGDDSTAVPVRLTTLSTTFTARYATELDAPSRQRAEALHQDISNIDLVYPVLPETREVTLVWREMMREVDAYCAAGALLTLQTPPTLLALREWLLAEVVAQVDGAEPTPWSGPDGLPAEER